MSLSERIRPAQARHLINPYPSPPSPAPERGFFMDI